MVSSMSGLSERERDRERSLVVGIRRDVDEAFVEEVVGEITEIDEAVEALETLRLRCGE